MGLRSLATGGVYICGGIIPRVRLDLVLLLRFRVSAQLQGFVLAKPQDPDSNLSAQMTWCSHDNEESMKVLITVLYKSDSGVWDEARMHSRPTRDNLIPSTAGCKS